MHHSSLISQDQVPQISRLQKLRICVLVSSLVTPSHPATVIAHLLETAITPCIFCVFFTEHPERIFCNQNQTLSSFSSVRNRSLPFVTLWISPHFQCGPQSLRPSSSAPLQLSSSCSLHCNHPGLSILPCFPHPQGAFAHTVPSA